MSPQEAYNKGLDDAELNIINNLKSLLNDEVDTSFPNPELEKVRIVIKERSNYYHELAKRKNTVGKSFTKKVAEQKVFMG